MAGRSAEVSQNLNNLLFAIWWVHSLHRWDREVVLRAAAAAVLVLEDETDIRSVAGMLEDVYWFFFDIYSSFYCCSQISYVHSTSGYGECVIMNLPWIAMANSTS
jgi:hypothetical protein